MIASKIASVASLHMLLRFIYRALACECTQIDGMDTHVLTYILSLGFALEDEPLF